MQFSASYFGSWGFFPCQHHGHLILCIPIAGPRNVTEGNNCSRHIKERFDPCVIYFPCLFVSDLWPILWRIEEFVPFVMVNSKACSRSVVAFLQLHDEKCDSLLCKYIVGERQLSGQVMFYDLLTYEILTNIPQYPNGPY